MAEPRGRAARVAAGIPLGVPVLLVVLLVSLLIAAGGLGSAWAADPSLDVELRPSRPLFAGGEPVALTVRLTVRSDLREVEIGFLLLGPGRVTDEPAEWETVASWRETVAVDAEGTLSVETSPPPDVAVEPGAYRVEAEVTASGERVKATTWIGVVDAQQQPVDLALVWLVALGPRRDADGVFVDESVQASVGGGSAEAGTLNGVLSLAKEFPAWRMTVALEPLYLRQLTAVADGYRKIGEEGSVVEVPPGDERCGNAALALEALRSVAALESIQFIPTPYATPHLALLATKGWDDGVDQMRLGRSEFQRLLQIPAPDGAYAPGLEMATNVIADFSGASVTYVPVMSHVLKDLAEEPDSFLLPVRVIDDSNNRLTLCPVVSGLRAALAEPWDASRFFAALASDVAAGKEGPFVAVPLEEYEIPPARFLEELGRGLAETDVVRTVTLAEVVERYPVSTRPRFLSRYAGHVDGVIGRALVDALESARSTVVDFGGAVEGAGATSEALSRARILLYEAQSMYFFRPGVDPAEVNRAISLSRRAGELAGVELAKVEVVAEAGIERSGGLFEAVVRVESGVAHALEIAALVEGGAADGSARESVPIRIEPGVNVIRVSLGDLESRGTVVIRLLAGETLLGRAKADRGGRVWTWAAPVGALVVLACVALFFVVRRYRCRRRPPSMRRRATPS